MVRATVLIRQAHLYHREGYEIPIDLYIELNANGICPEQLEQMFEADLTPEDIMMSHYL